jgi:hypothetical protein
MERATSTVYAPLSCHRRDSHTPLLDVSDGGSWIRTSGPLTRPRLSKPLHYRSATPPCRLLRGVPARCSASPTIAAAPSLRDPSTPGSQRPSTCLTRMRRQRSQPYKRKVLTSMGSTANSRQQCRLSRSQQ